MKMRQTIKKTKHAFHAAAAIVLLVASNIAWANADLASEKDCFSCHSVDEKSIGPAYQDVAARYAGQPDAVAHLVNRVLKGSTGDWGQRRMPANKNVSEAEARALVEWVLSLKNNDATLAKSH